MLSFSLIEVTGREGGHYRGSSGKNQAAHDSSSSPVLSVVPGLSSRVLYTVAVRHFWVRPATLRIFDPRIVDLPNALAERLAPSCRTGD